MLVDVHQHLWTEPLLERLRARRTLPLVSRTAGLTVLHCEGEQPYVIDVGCEAPEQRAALVRADGLDLALVAISSPVGIEALPRDDALELIDAHLEGVSRLPREFAVWGPVAIDGADPDQVDHLVQRGCVGISVAAGALAGPERLARIGGLLERASDHRVPVLVHPGPAPEDWSAPPAFGEPVWWRGLIDYVAQMHAAWLTFASFGRRELPDLTIVFSMLAGGAPLLTERLKARGGPPIDLRDPRCFYDTSSYGLAAIEMMAQRVGAGQLLYGSDRPVIDPVSTSHDDRRKAAGSVLLGLGAALT